MPTRKRLIIIRHNRAHLERPGSRAELVVGKIHSSFARESLLVKQADKGPGARREAAAGLLSLATLSHRKHYALRRIEINVNRVLTDDAS